MLSLYSLECIGVLIAKPIKKNIPKKPPRYGKVSNDDKYFYLIASKL